MLHTFLIVLTKKQLCEDGIVDSLIEPALRVLGPHDSRSVPRLCWKKEKLPAYILADEETGG